MVFDAQNRPGRKKGITAKQRVFIEEYLRDSNGKRAASAAGYSQPDQRSYRLLHDERYALVQEEIRQLQEEMRQDCRIEARQLVEELAKVAFFNPKTMLDSEGNLLEMKDLPDHVSACISEFKISTEKGKRFLTVKFHSKLSALEQLAKHLGLFRDVTQVNNLVQVIDWDSLFGRRPVVDPVEDRIVEVERLTGDRSDG